VGERKEKGKAGGGGGKTVKSYLPLSYPKVGENRSEEGGLHILWGGGGQKPSKGKEPGWGGMVGLFFKFWVDRDLGDQVNWGKGAEGLKKVAVWGESGEVGEKKKKKKRGKGKEEKVRSHRPTSCRIRGGTQRGGEKREYTNLD